MKPWPCTQTHLSNDRVICSGDLVVYSIVHIEGLGGLHGDLLLLRDVIYTKGTTELTRGGGKEGESVYHHHVIMFLPTLETIEKALPYSSSGSEGLKFNLDSWLKSISLMTIQLVRMGTEG